LEECVISTFTVDKLNKKVTSTKKVTSSASQSFACNLLHAGFFPGLFFNSEDRSDMFSETQVGLQFTRQCYKKELVALYYSYLLGQLIQLPILIFDLMASPNIVFIISLLLSMQSIALYYSL
jgi:hypothetical protein